MSRAKLLLSVVILVSAAALDAAAECRPQIAGKAQSGPNMYAIIGLANPTPFTISDRGAKSFTTFGTAATTSVGYARLQADAGSTTPAGYLVFSVNQNGVLISEATVPATRPVQSGRIYAEVAGSVNTGLAIVNPSTSPAAVSFYFTDSNGQNFGQGSFTLNPNTQIARFLNESPFMGAGTIRGTLTFTSSVPVGVIAIRGLTNERGEFLITTLPVADVTVAPTAGFLFPHYADGGGWTTQVVLVNTTDSTITGSVDFLGTGGSTSSYSIAPRSSQRVVTSGAGSVIQAGAVRVTPAAGNAAPSGLSIFSFKSNGVTVTEAGVPVLRASQSFRMYEIECGDHPGELQTGIAIANPSTTNAATVTLDMSDLNGVSTGKTSTLTIPPSGHFSAFMTQLPGFESLGWPFHGVLRISTTSSSGVSVVGIRGHVNTRQDFLVTTSTPSDESVAGSTSETIFADLADGGGYSTEFILFSGSNGQSSSGTLRFFTQSGAPLN
ncbi:MAG TPA: hypothetical protein VE422_03045 [Terriglobia bacterium]|nr:hypothetical protein [Terriglobia bacterium]